MYEEYDSTRFLDFLAPPAAFLAGAAFLADFTQKENNVMRKRVQKKKRKRRRTKHHMFCLNRRRYSNGRSHENCYRNRVKNLLVYLEFSPLCQILFFMRLLPIHFGLVCNNRHRSERAEFGLCGLCVCQFRHLRRGGYFCRRP